MLTILQKASCEEAVKTWAQADIGESMKSCIWEDAPLTQPQDWNICREM